MQGHQSPWLTRAGERFAPLDADAAFDVAVLGAGIAGLSVGFMLKSAGLDVAVLEAGRVAVSTTGHTTAKVSAQHGLVYDDLRSRLGCDGARLYAEANTMAIAAMESIVHEHSIDCDWERLPAYVYAESEETLGAVEAEVEAASRAGLVARFVESTELPWPVAGAVRTDDQAQFQPYGYCHALARLIDGDGSRVYELTRALDVTDGAPCVVQTGHHRLTAAHVVVATHLPFLDAGAFVAKGHPSREYALAATLAGPAPHGMYISADSPSRSLRRHLLDGREVLIVAGETHRTGEEPHTGRRHEVLEGFVRERFDVRDVPFSWSTQDQMSIDRVPFIGPLRRGSPRIMVATGFSGWGMTHGTVAGLLLTDQVLGRDNPWSGLYDPHRIKPAAGAVEFVKHNTGVAKHFIGDRLGAGSEPDLDALGPGEGVVFASGQGHLAASRDDDGRLHVHSAGCTHLGCLVAWNEAERSWDCPCHGSRFAQDGSVLEGPAVEPLPTARVGIVRAR